MNKVAGNCGAVYGILKGRSNAMVEKLTFWGSEGFLKFYARVI
jgi:hypothetical protein